MISRVVRPAYEGSNACTQWDVSFTHAGACTITARASDGRQATASVNVVVEHENTCCGTLYPYEPLGSLISFPDFSVADASSGEGG
jgi:hypothetical protein